jgi:sodium-dependent dicarboxylate transporter 2/3/5
MWMTRATNGDVPGWGSYFHGYADDGTVSILMAMFLFILPLNSRAGEKLMNWADCKKLPWDIVLVLGGGFALADGIRASGLSEWIALHLDFLHSIPYILITPSVAIIVAIVTEFTSNNATATIFLPLLAEVSLSLNIHPLFLMVTATIASSFSFMLPIATPPNAVAYTAGKLKMTDLAVPGFLLKCTGIFLLSVLMPTLGTVVFNLDQKFQN